MRDRVFISYSHKDRKHLDRLRVHLRPLERSGLVDLWADTELEAGDRWKSEIAEAIDNCKAAILLISADFLASQFIAENELPRLLRAAKLDGVTILPVIVGASRFTKTPGLSEFQSVNDPGKPIALLPAAERERVWVRVADSVEAILQSRDVSEGWAVKNERLVRESLNELVHSTSGSFLIVSAGDYYVQFKVEGGDLYMEAVSNHYLPEIRRLSPFKEQALLALGFEKPTDISLNFNRTISRDSAVPDVNGLARLAVKAMADVYEVSQASPVSTQLTLDS